MNILWMSDSPTHPTGFGNVTGHVCGGLADYGHQVSILGWQTRSQERWHKCRLYPLHLQSSPTVDDFLGYLRKIRPDVLVMLSNVPWFPQFHHPLIAKFAQAAGIAWAFYYPIDGEVGEHGLPADWIAILKTVELPITMSQYASELSQINGVRTAYIPLGVDTSLFRPPTTKELAKRALGYEGRFVILSDACNHPRKQLPRTLEIFRRFAEGRDDVLLHLHADPEDPAAHTLEYCYDLRSEIAALGLTDKVRLTPGLSISKGIAMTQLVKLYQAADVHLLASMGEGFGLPTLQAAATGVVPLACDYTASQELVTGHGEALRVQHFWSDQIGIRRAFIDIDEAVRSLERLYGDRELLACKAQQARRFAEAYDWQLIVREWHELLQREVFPRVRYPWFQLGQAASKKGEPTHKREEPTHKKVNVEFSSDDTPSSTWEIFLNPLSSSFASLTPERTFSFHGKKLFYNRIRPHHITERAVEIPLAFDFLAHLPDQGRILEIGNVLLNYENSLSEFVGIRQRRIVDKFEIALGVDNVDVMDLPSEEKYPAIVSISTVEHVGQGLDPEGAYGEQDEARDLEAPLKAIAKIYDLLCVGGKAFITVPFGKLLDRGWLIQFSREYLNLLVKKFGVPQEALSVSFLKRFAIEQGKADPYQLWVEAKAEDLTEARYGALGPCAGAIAIIELIKLPDTFVLNLDVPPTPLMYEKE